MKTKALATFLGIAIMLFALYWMFRAVEFATYCAINDEFAIALMSLMMAYPPLAFAAWIDKGTSKLTKEGKNNEQ